MNLAFDYEIVRTNRKKTASIKVIEGQVQIVVPLDLPQAKIDDLIQKRKSWITKKLYIHSQFPPSKPKEYVSGECFTYFGKNYRLKLIPDGSKSIKLVGGCLELQSPKDTVKDRDQYVRNHLCKWYKERAQEKLSEKMKRFANDLKVSPKSFKVRDYKSRWGGCSIHGDISYNWRIVMAPNRIVDYVVVHELCHLIEHNHSSQFWNNVERVIPEWRECRDWLKVHGSKLVV